jgi:UDP-glucose 4-epimerase
MKILLTGGAGYVGSACLRRLLRNGHDAVAYDDLSAGNANSVPKSRLIVGDINDGPRLTAVLRDGKFDTVMHFAALASVPDSINDPASYYHVNVTGTKTVLDAMRAAGIARLICSSTAATYSFAAKMPLNEESPRCPTEPQNWRPSG